MAEPHSELPPFIRSAFPFPRKRIETSWGSISYAEAGKGRPVLLLHGNPTWGFLYRHVMAQLQSKNLRLLAPDLIGFGTSYKPRKISEHSLQRHGETLIAFVEKLKLTDIILVGQDWGGPIGMWMTASLPDRVSALLLMNTAVLVPRNLKTTPFHRFSHIPILSELAFYACAFPVPVMHLVQGNRKSLSKKVKGAYYWPFRKLKDRAGPLALARMVPNSKDHPTMAELKKTDQAFRSFKGKVAFVWGKKDPILGRALKRHRQIFPNAYCVETDAGHFIQEEAPDHIAQAIDWLAKER